MGVGLGLGVIPIASVTACTNSQQSIGIEPCTCDFDASTASDASDGSTGPEVFATPDAGSSDDAIPSEGATQAASDASEAASNPPQDAAGVDP